MAKRFTLLVVLALVLPATALSATVKVRVEGKTRTLFAPTEVTVTATNALDALEQASIIGEFYYHVTVTASARTSTRSAATRGSGSSGWVFKVDDVSPPVGADQVPLKDGDRVLWYYATFGPNGGPPTLRLNPATGGLLRRTGPDDDGKAARSPSLVLHVGSSARCRAARARRSARRAQGPARPRHRDDAVRSNALR